MARHARQIDNVSQNLSQNLSKDLRQNPSLNRRDNRNSHVRGNYIEVRPNPHTYSRESQKIYANRVSRNSLVEESKRKSKRRRRIVGAIIAVAAVIVSLAVAFTVFMRTTDSRLSLEDDSIKEALVATQPDNPYYVLCVSDLSDPRYSYTADYDDALMLVRVDDSSKKIGFASIPAKLLVKNPDDQEVELANLIGSGQYAELIRDISDFFGTGISHIFFTDYKKLHALVDNIGGVEVNIPQEIDDPIVGSSKIPSGERSLNADESLKLIRASNLFGGFSATSLNRELFTSSLISKALDSSQVELATLLSDAADYVDTDWTTSDILAVADKFKPPDQITFYNAEMPCSIPKDSKDGLFRYDQDDMSAFLESFRNGDSGDGDAESTDPAQSGITVEVRNGAGIQGAAATLGAILENDGYKVSEVGNTNDDTIYPETLIVFTKTGTEAEAQTVMRDIGNGRIVEGGDFYTSKAKVIVIIGSDWTG